MKNNKNDELKRLIASGESGVVERYGTGFIRIRKRLQADYPETQLLFTSEQGAFTIIIGTTSEKTSEKILQLLTDDPSLTIAVLAKRCGVTTRSIERNVTKLQADRKLRRVGPDKGGHWEVC